MAQPLDIIVEDLIGAIEQAQSFVAGIEVISVASRRIPARIKKEHPDIPWSNVAGIGNILRHDYRSVAGRIVWDTLDVHLPPLLRTMRAIEASLRKET
jgi:uncharacterized protein with HEPN domain